MSTLNALALSVGVLAGVATWLFLGPLAGALQIWIAFVAWGSFYHCGGKVPGLRNTVVCSAFGALLGWLALLLILAVPLAGPLGLPLWAGIAVALLVAVAVLAAGYAPLGTIPATVYGFATFAGLFLLSGKLTVEALTVGTIANPLLVTILSLIVGALFGYVSEIIATAVTKSSTAAHARA